MVTVVLAALSAVPLPALAAQAPAAAPAASAPQDFLKVDVKSEAQDGSQRITFAWPQSVAYTANQQGDDLIITFKQAALFNLAPIVDMPASLVASLNQSIHDAASEVRLHLQPGVKGVAAPDGVRLVVTLTPLAKDAATQPPASADKTGTEKVPEIASSAASAPAKAPEGKPDAENRAGNENWRDDLARDDQAQLALAESILKRVAKPKREAPDLGMADDGSVVPLASFNPAIVTGAAIFKRADYVYVVFSEKLKLPLEQFFKPVAPLELEPVESDGTVYRFYLPQNVSLRIERQDSMWNVLATKKDSAAPINLGVTPQPNYALGARLMITISKASSAVHFFDPEVGDPLIAIPLEQPGQAIRQGNEYADLRFLPAEQGILIKPKIDGVDARLITQGVEITSHNGLRLSPEADTGIENTSYEGQDTARLFDFKAWYGPEKMGYTQMRQRWERTLGEVAPGERDRVRFDEARFQFARHHSAEARGLLDMLATNLPDITRRGEFMALSGAVNVETRHPAEALKNFEHPDIRNLPEGKLWQAVAQAQLLEWSKATDLFKQADQILDRYPEPYFTRFSLLAVEAALAANDAVYGGKVMDRLLQRHPDLEQSSAAVLYLRGVFLNLAGHLDRAEIMWKRAEKGDSPLYRVRAILALTDLDIVRGKIKPAQAAERLERLRFAWRGDDLELDVLRRLGKFYIEAGKVADGLTVLKQVLAFLPDNEAAKKLRDEMAQAFRDVFLGSRSDDLSPLDALSLYERFYELAPLGNEGDGIIRNLAERMVAVDLLDRAAYILSDQVRRRLSSTFKARVGAQAAGIYLLDGKPEPALSILSDSEVPSLPPELINERQLLKARALYDDGKKDEAKALLKELTGDNAERLRVDIAWKERNWAEAARALGELIGSPPPEGIEIAQTTAKMVISRAIALAMQNDIQGLEEMRKQFGAPMKKTPQASLFRDLTEAENALPTDAGAMKALSADVQLFGDVLEGYRTIK